MQELLPDTTISHYRIVSKLGVGGMGEVFLARDTSELERTVALKFLPAELASDQKRMQRFIQEAKTVSALNHPNILTIYEFGQSGSVRFIAMEYVDGVTLREYMRERHLKLHDVLDIAAQIAAALNAAHEAGVVHRDIKPENIMVRRDHIVKVLDFGLAKLTMKEASAESVAVDSEAGTKVLVHTEPGLVMGTASYMSPEQSQGSANVDHRTDIWSLGVVLYECIAARVPFEGKDIHRQIIAIQEQEAPPLSKFAEGVPERLEEIVEKALAKDPDERYQTAKDLLIDLRNLKRKLDVDAEIERTIAPELRSTSSNASGAQSTVSNAQESTAQTASGGQAQPTSSAEYIVSKIKQHKRGALTIVFALVFAAAAVAIHFFAKRNVQPTGSTSVEAIDSIAVLPLVNESHDPNVDWLADGLTESIIYKLSQLPNLKVLARSTVFRYKGKDIDAAQVAHELNVRAVLTGRVMQRGDDLTVSAELIDARDNRLLWGERYERKMTDLNAVQQEIARIVSEKLRQKLTGEEQKQLAKGNTENSEAYQLYLKGRYFWNRRTGEAIKQSVEYFNQAIERDPNYALAYTGLADAYNLMSVYDIAPPSEVYPKAKEAARRALALDDTLAEAHTSWANVLETYEWKFSEAENEYRQAIRLNPNYGTAHQWLAELLSKLGRHKEAIDEIKRALEVDPLSLIINAVAGRIYELAGQYDEAIAQLKRTIAIDKNFRAAHDFLSSAYEDKGMYEEAISEFQTARISAGLTPEEAARGAAVLRQAYRTAGAKGYWQKVLELTLEHAKSKYTPPDNLAGAYARVGDKERMYEWLQKAYDERGTGLGQIKVEPAFEPYRSEPRFQELMRKVGLPQ